MNEGCNFGTATANTWQETNVAVGHVVQIAEERHYNAVVSMAETTNEVHQLQMASVMREASDALQRQAQDHASDTQRIQREAATNADN